MDNGSDQVEHPTFGGARVSTGRFARERAGEMLGKGDPAATAWALVALYDLLYGEFAARFDAEEVKAGA